MVVKSNPCRYCSSACHDEEKHVHIPSFDPSCTECNYRKLYEEHLRKKRKYIEGKIVKSLEELLEQKVVFLNGIQKTIHQVKEVKLNTIEKNIKNGAYKRAVRNNV